MESCYATSRSGGMHQILGLGLARQHASGIATTTRPLARCRDVLEPGVLEQAQERMLMATAASRDATTACSDLYGTVGGWRVAQDSDVLLGMSHYAPGARASLLLTPSGMLVRATGADDWRLPIWESSLQAAVTSLGVDRAAMCCVATCSRGRGALASDLTWAGLFSTCQRFCGQCGPDIGRVCKDVYFARSGTVLPAGFISDVARLGVRCAAEVVYCAMNVCGRLVANTDFVVGAGEMYIAVLWASRGTGMIGIDEFSASLVNGLDYDYSEDYVSRDEVVWALDCTMQARAKRFHSGRVNDLATAILSSGSDRTNEVVVLYLLSEVAAQLFDFSAIDVATAQIDPTSGSLLYSSWGILETWAGRLLERAGMREAHVVCMDGFGRRWAPCLSMIVPVWLLPCQPPDCGYCVEPQFDDYGVVDQFYSVRWGDGNEYGSLDGITRTGPLARRVTSLSQMGRAYYVADLIRQGRVVSTPPAIYSETVPDDVDVAGLVAFNGVSYLKSLLNIGGSFMEGGGIRVYADCVRTARCWRPRIPRVGDVCSGAVLAPALGLSWYDSSGLFSYLRGAGMDGLLAVVSCFPATAAAVSMLTYRSLADADTFISDHLSDTEQAVDYASNADLQGKWTPSVVPNSDSPHLLRASFTMLRSCTRHQSGASLVWCHLPDSYGACAFGAAYESLQRGYAASAFDKTGWFGIDHMQGYGCAFEVEIDADQRVLGNVHVVLSRAGIVFRDCWRLDETRGGHYGCGHVEMGLRCRVERPLTVPYVPCSLRLAGGRRPRTRYRCSVDVVEWLIGAAITKTVASGKRTTAYPKRKLHRTKGLPPGVVESTGSGGAVVTLQHLLPKHEILIRGRERVKWAVLADTLTRANISSCVFGSAVRRPEVMASILVSTQRGLLAQRLLLAGEMLKRALVGDRRRHKEYPAPGGRALARSVRQQWFHPLEPVRPPPIVGCGVNSLQDESVVVVSEARGYSSPVFVQHPPTRVATSRPRPILSGRLPMAATHSTTTLLQPRPAPHPNQGCGLLPARDASLAVCDEERRRALAYGAGACWLV